jgi:proteasome lid subunit RPN8/RPN11
MEQEHNIKKYTKLTDALNIIKKWSEENLYTEICGFLGFDLNENKYIAKLEKNCASDPRQFFAISSLNYLLFKNQYEMLSVFHSHIIGDEDPSEFDIKMSENCCIPFLVYSINTKQFKVHEPINCEYNLNIFNKIKTKI